MLNLFRFRHTLGRVVQRLQRLFHGSHLFFALVKANSNLQLVLLTANNLKLKINYLVEYGWI
jgi:hypothetical protein